MERKKQRTPSDMLAALKEAQKAFRGEAERLGLKDEQDVVEMIKRLRQEEKA